MDLKSKGYSPWEYYQSNPELREAVDQIRSGFFSRGDKNLFQPLVESLLSRDEYLLFADYPFYVGCQERVNRAYQDPKNWTKMSILNVARMGKFSSDRSIREYSEKIWMAKPVKAK